MKEWKNNKQSVQKSPLPTGRPVGCIQSTPKVLNSGKPRINPESSSLEGLNLGPPEYKSSTLTIPPYCLDLTLVTSINSVEKKGLTVFLIQIFSSMHQKRKQSITELYLNCTISTCCEKSGLCSILSQGGNFWVTMCIGKLKEKKILSQERLEEMKTPWHPIKMLFKQSNDPTGDLILKQLQKRRPKE